MTYLTNDLLKKIAPNISASLRAEFLKWLNVYCFQFEINSELRLGAFLANVMAESGRFTRLEENLNYSAKRLRQVWPARFPTLAFAQNYAGKPQKLANYVYGGRNGNRGQHMNDGWIFRGGGLNQTTGLENYQKTGDRMGVDLVKRPELLRQPRYAVWSACVEFRRRGCNQMADRREIVGIRRAINGGTNGLEDVKIYYAQVMRWLPDGFALAAPNDLVKLTSSVEAITAEDVPDFIDAEDEGQPAWHDETDVLTLSEGVESEGQPELPDSNSNHSNEQQTGNTAASGDEDKPETSSGAAEGATTDDKIRSPQVVDKERPSTFVKWLTGIKVAIGTAIAGISAYCGGSEVQTLVATKAVEKADPSILSTAGIILAFTLLFVGIGVLLIWIASIFYDRSAERSNKLNSQKVDKAASQVENTVEYKK